MKILKIIPLFLFLLSTSLIYSQAQLSKAYFNKVGGVELILEEDLTKLPQVLKLKGVTIDHGATPEEIRLYANYTGYKNLLDGKYRFSILEKATPQIVMKNHQEVQNWKKQKMDFQPMDFYPTYEAYELMMYGFAVEYPDLCEVIEIGTLDTGRKILALKISDNIDVQEEEPEFLYTSSMHGDELAGFPMMLSLIDYLLSQYQTDPQATLLVDNLVIYINPLANPNGTYRFDNNTVANAIRGNNFFVDLNRNFPDPEDGTNPDFNVHQEETLLFMQFSEDHNINMACNLHGGIELANYPWDTFDDLHADDAWWQRICRTYADTVQHYGHQGYFDAQNNGITNGYQWYEVQGGRQDYNGYFHRDREFTLELSNQKILDADLLDDHWSYNKAALLNYMREALYGLKGKVTDCKSGEPLEAEIWIDNHDTLNTSVFSRAVDGMYFRYLAEGNYTVNCSTQGYDTLTTFINMVDKSTVLFDVELCPLEMVSTQETIDNNPRIRVQANKIDISLSNTTKGSTEIEIYDQSGRTVYKHSFVGASTQIDLDLPTGVYVIFLKNTHKEYNQKILLQNGF